MKIQVGKRIIKKDQMVCLSKDGTLRAWRSPHDYVIGVASTDLKKGIIAESLPGTTGNFVDKILWDNYCLTKVSAKYFKPELINERLLK